MNTHAHAYVEMIVAWSVVALCFLGPWTLNTLSSWMDAWNKPEKGVDPPSAIISAFFGLLALMCLYLALGGEPWLWGSLSAVFAATTLVLIRIGWRDARNPSRPR